jgi:hypothetical protein
MGVWMLATQFAGWLTLAADVIHFVNFALALWLAKGILDLSACRKNIGVCRTYQIFALALIAFAITEVIDIVNVLDPLVWNPLSALTHTLFIAVVFFLISFMDRTTAAQDFLAKKKQGPGHYE